MTYPDKSLEETIAYLNELLELDPMAMFYLIEARVPCNKALADHPTAVVMDYKTDPRIGVLGVLNGLFGLDDEGWGGISAVFDDDETTLLRFERTRPRHEHEDVYPVPHLTSGGDK